LLRLRIITGAVLGTAVTVAVLLLPTSAMAAVLGVLWVVGAWEWAGLAGRHGPPRWAYTAAVAAVMAAALVWPWPLEWLEGAAWTALAWWIVAFVAVVRYPAPFPDGGILPAGVAALIPAWLLLARLHSAGPRGAALTLMAFVLVWAADVGAYTFGRLVGRVKLAPRVSPGKTWEGVVGGAALAAAAAAAASLWLGLPPLALIVLAVVTALVSVVGDLTVSMLKRGRGLKDTGHVLPGHGGVLDRIDGLIAAVPAFVLGLKWIGVIDW
jgi:phosphatidate cytidylyltransferase